MALQYSPKITTDGLVMCLDASQNKSYPTTDLPVKDSLILWLDAADDTTFSYSSGTEVSQWRDKSGNNFHANQSTVAQQPSRSSVVNSRKGVNFTSLNGDFMRVSSGIVTPNYITVFAVIQPAAQDNSYAIILEQDHANGYNGWVIQRNFNTSYWQAWVASAASAWLNPNQISYTNSTSQIVTLRKNASTINLYSNGTSSSAVSISDTAITQTSYGLNLGYWQYGGGRYYNGVMCEILVFNRGLSDTEVKQVNTYLGQKWGILNADRSIIDLSGLDDNGLLGDGATANMPAFGYYNKGSLKFDGSNDYINVGNPSSVNFGSGDFSVEMWFTRDTNAATNLRLLSKGAESDASGSAGFAFFGSDSGINFAINPSGTRSIISAASYSVGEWVHVVGVVQRGSTMRTYKNAVLTNSATAPAGSVSNASINLNIGRSAESASLYWPGNIAIVRMYNKALSVNEVLQNYEAQKTRFINYIVTNGLVLNLDAGNPYSYAGAGTTWYDVSGNSYNGTLTSNPVYSKDSGGAFKFAGNYSLSPASTVNSLNGDALTVEAWIKHDSFGGVGTGRSYVSNWHSFNTLDQRGFILRTYDTQTYPSFWWCWGGGNNYYSSGPSTYAMNIGQIYHIVATYEKNVAMKIYINGILQWTETNYVNQTIAFDTTNGVYVGFSNINTSYMDGNIYSARLYNRVLSAAQVLQNYNATKGRFGL